MKTLPVAFAVLFFSACAHFPDASKLERSGTYSCGSIDSELVLTLHADGAYEEVFSGGVIPLREGEPDHGFPQRVVDRGHWEDRADRILLRGSKAFRILKIVSGEAGLALDESVGGESVRHYTRNQENPSPGQASSVSGRGSP